MDTVCGYCGVGCGITLTAEGTADSRRVLTSTGTGTHPANRGRLCTKGSTTADLLNAGGRQSTALIDGKPVGLDEAVSEAARRFTAIREEHGDDAVAFYVSGQMSLESQYLSNKLAKGYFRTNLIESNSRLCMASAATGYKQSLGADGPPGSYDDLDHADVFLVIGANMADCHPILFLRMMDRVKAGAKLIVVDPRFTATAKKADLYLPVRPGTDMALLNGLLRLITDAGDVDEEFIAEFTEGWDAMPSHLADYPVDTVSEITGIAVDDLKTAAAWIGSTRNLMSLWTMGLNQSVHGTWHTTALCNLHLATGAICHEGAGPFSLTGQPNAMGGREMGYMGPGLPGQRTVLNPDHRLQVEEIWQIPQGTLHDNLGGGTVDMFDALADGRIKAVWVICTNPVASVANRSRVIAALENAECVVVQDAFAGSATAEYADVLLPAALWTESEGVMVNSERTLTLTAPLMDSPGQARPDWELICRVAQEMGFAGFDFPDASSVFDEIRRFHNPETGWDIRGVDYPRLRRGPVQWPAPASSPDSRHPVRYLNDGISQSVHTDGDGNRPRLAFPTPSRRAQFLARPYLPPAECPDANYPLVLTTGRLPHQWHTMTKTGRVAKLMKLNPSGFVHLHPTDAEARDIAEGDLVEIASRRGSVQAPAVVNDGIIQGTCFMPMHFPDQVVNEATNDAVDPESLQPEFKACAVDAAKVAVSASAAVSASGDMLDRIFDGDGHSPAPVLTDLEKVYLDGMLRGLRANPPQDAVPAVPVVPAQAPLSPQARAWVDGTLAGMFSRLAPLTDDGGPDDDATDLSSDSPAVTVAWASQTGTVEDYVPSLVAAISERGYSARAVPADDVGAEGLTGTVLFVVSSTGDGEAPDNGESLWDTVMAMDPHGSPSCLQDLSYSVLGFGDSSYSDFCGFARSLDERLAELGATRIAAWQACEPNYESTARTWQNRVLDALPDAGAPAPAPVAAQTPVPTPAPTYSRRHPLITKILESSRLTGDDSAKDVRRVAFALPKDTLSYTTGDALGVWPTNRPEVVDEWLSLTGLDPDTDIRVDETTLPLREALTTTFDITTITPDVLRLVHTHHPHAGLAGTDGIADDPARAREFAWGRHTADLLTTHAVDASAEEWAQALPRMKPRMYSICSSPHTDATQVEITVSAVEFRTDGGRRRGVCSGFLAQANAGDRVRIFVSPNKNFGPPEEPSAPVIMVGPGTGVAPFRGFLHDRRHRGATGDSWLFFGEQHAATDFLYQDEFTGLRKDGVLTRLDTAFSRDQKDKVYVQDLMLRNAGELWSWIDRGAYLYVCGDARKMAPDVDATLHRIVAEQGRMDPEAARRFMSVLSSERRYVKDVY